MAKTETTSEAKTVDQDAQWQAEALKAKMRWEGSQMRSTYANVCNVTSSREEVTLLFGTNQNWHAGQKELTIELSDRMILNPYAAKRLSYLLANTVLEYEKRFGELQLDISKAKTN